MSNMHMIPPSTWDVLPSALREGLSELTPSRQEQFMEEYSRKKKSIGIAYLLWFLLGLHYVYLGKWGVTLLMWLTMCMVIGFIWWMIDIFRIPSMVRSQNMDTATDVFRSLKSMWN